MTKRIMPKKKAARKPKTDNPKTGKSNKANNGDKAADKKNTSLRLDKQTLKALKIHAIENDTSIQHLIESLIKDYLKKKPREK